MESNMKKLLSLIIVSLFIFTFVSCSNLSTNVERNTASEKGNETGNRENPDTPLTFSKNKFNIPEKNLYISLKLEDTLNKDNPNYKIEDITLQKGDIVTVNIKGSRRKDPIDITNNTIKGHIGADDPSWLAYKKYYIEDDQKFIKITPTDFIGAYGEKKVLPYFKNVDTAEVDFYILKRSCTVSSKEFAEELSSDKPDVHVACTMHYSDDIAREIMDGKNSRFKPADIMPE
jgi:hypothetical protein